MLPGLAPCVPIRGNPALIPQAYGTIIGDMNTPSLAFNGVTNAGNGACTNRTNLGWVGKTYPKRAAISQIKTWGSNGDGYAESNNGTVTFNVRGKQGAAPTGGTDGTILATLVFTDTANSNPKDFSSTNVEDYWDHVFIEIIRGTNGNNAQFAEVEFYGWLRE